MQVKIYESNKACIKYPAILIQFSTIFIEYQDYTPLTHKVLRFMGSMLFVFLY